MAEDEHVSDTEGGRGGGTPSPASPVIAVRAPEYSVRSSLRPPARFTPGTDLELWIKRFELYVRRIGVAKEQWTVELLPLLDDAPFRVIDQLGLVESADYDAVIAQLKRQYSPSGNEFEWQFRLQNRAQKPGESLIEYAGSLRVLADKAYPSWSPEQRQDALRSQFVQGVQSPSVQLYLMREKPANIDAALEMAIQRESVEASQKRLLREKQKSESLVVQDIVDDSPSANALMHRGAGEARQLKELKEQVQQLTEEVARLRATKQPAVTRSGAVCWSCGERGHIKRNCPSKRQVNPQPRARSSNPRVAAINSTLTVQGQVGGQPISMLVDTGSAACLIREDIWRRTAKGQVALRPHTQAVVAANGGEMDLLGVTDMELQVGTIVANHPVLVARNLTQSCLLGADFLKKYGCIIDLHEGTFTAGNLSVRFEGEPLEPIQNSSITNVCHVTCMETTVIPGYSQMQLPLIVSEPQQGEPGGSANGALLEPHAEFMERHGLLVAHCLVTTKGSQVPVRILNPSPAPVTVYQSEKVGQLRPLGEENSMPVQTVETRPLTKTANGMANEAIEKLVADTEGLTKIEQAQLHELLQDFSDVISTGAADLGRTNLTQHRIDTGDAKPIKQSVRRLPFQQRQHVRELLDNMLEQGVIEPAKGPWASPIVLVRKKDGTTRFCVDFRKVNEVTRKDAQPLPRIDDTIDTLHGAKWFSTLDLASGYWQVEVEPEDREKTAFTTPFGIFQFRVMPFGLCNAPGTFQRLMERVLAGLHWTSCLVYIDDIIIFSKTIDEHLLRLRDVLTRLRIANLKLKPIKCQLFRRSVDYLGHKISNEGVTTDSRKVECIVAWKTPENLKELRRFLGLASYYRRFVKGFAQIASPLHHLTQAGRRWLWTEECDRAFLRLKQELASTPILVFPDFEKKFILDVDASGEGLGAVLSQSLDGSEHVIAYASRTLSKTERKYCATRRELLALVWGARHFRPYLYGQSFRVRTDHNALRWLHSFKEPEGQVARWLEILAEYNMEIEHRQGKQHCNADALSRGTCQQCTQTVPETKSPIEADSVASSHLYQNNLVDTAQPQNDDTWLASKNLKDLQHSDEDLKQAIQWLERDDVPPKIPKQGSRYLQALWNQRKDLILRDGILYRKWKDIPGNGIDRKLQLVLPTHLVPEVLMELHNGPAGGHLGVNKTLEKIRARFYFLNLPQVVEKWCRQCELCSSRKSPSKRPRAPMQLSMASSPMERIAMDILGPLPATSRGNKYILVVGDYFSKWKEAYPMPNMEATTIATFLVNEFICRFGVPQYLHTDQGRNFEASLMKEMCRLLGIKKTHTTPYHPQSDGLIERFNRTLLSMLSIAAKDDEHDWDLKLPTLLWAYRTSVQETTGETPSLLMLGREASLPIDVLYNLPQQKQSSGSAYLKQLKENMMQAQDRVRTRMKKEQQKQKANYDRSSDTKVYSVGEKVWLNCPAVPRGLSPKFHRPWKGPFTVVKVFDKAVYRIQSDCSPRKRLVVHSNRLKPYHGGQLTTPEADTRAQTSEKEDCEGGNSAHEIQGDDDELLIEVQGQPHNSDHNTPYSEQEERETSSAALSSDAESSEKSASSEPEEDPSIAPPAPLRRSTRLKKPPDWYGTVITFQDGDESDEF